MIKNIKKLTAMNQTHYRNTYYVLASIEGMIDSYAIKEVKTDAELEIDSNLFGFDIDSTTILYVGLKIKDFNSVDKIGFSLGEYKTKINKYVYKIKLEEALSRLAYGCNTIVANTPVTTKLLAEACVIGEKRHESFNKPTEIIDAKAKAIIINAFKVIESNWLSYWKQNYERLLSFNHQHPLPLKKNYFRSGVSALAFGKFNEVDYIRDFKDYRNKSNWLINKLSEESQSLKMDFNASCPTGCGKTISFDVNFQNEHDTKYYYVDDGFPFGIYKLIKRLEGSCPECGSFSITYSEDTNDDENLTCVFNNRIPEYIFYTLKKRIEIINQLIEDELYGTN